MPELSVSQEKRITKYFRSKDAIEFDKEIRELEKENLQERKRRKELQWLDKRKEEGHRKAAKWAANTMDLIVTEAWIRIVQLEEKRKLIRLETAGWKTITARIRNWTLSNREEVKEPQRKRRKDQSHADSPSKKKRESNQQGLQSDEKHVSNQEGEHKARGVRSKTNQLEKTAPKKKTTTSGPKIRIPQVKTKRWLQKKNGLFGWITSIVEKKQSAPREVPPHDILAGGGGSKIHQKNKKIFKQWAGG